MKQKVNGTCKYGKVSLYLTFLMSNNSNRKIKNLSLNELSYIKIEPRHKLY